MLNYRDHKAEGAGQKLARVLQFTGREEFGTIPNIHGSIGFGITIAFSPFFMRDKTERWFQLCEQAATEQDPQKLLELVKEINELLEAKERRLNQQRDPGKSPSP